MSSDVTAFALAALGVIGTIRSPVVAQQLSRSARQAEYAAKALGTCPPDDLAVLHVDAPGLLPAAFADSNTRCRSATSRSRSATRWACRPASPKES